jgi:hypothetical protein
VTEELVDFLRVSIGLQDRLKALVGGLPVPKSASADASEHSDYRRRCRAGELDKSGHQVSLLGSKSGPAYLTVSSSTFPV